MEQREGSSGNSCFDRSAAGGQAHCVGRWWLLAILALGTAGNGCSKPQPPEESWDPAEPEATPSAPSGLAAAAPVPEHPAPTTVVAAAPTATGPAPTGGTLQQPAAAGGAAAVTAAPPPTEHAVLEVAGGRVRVDSDAAQKIRAELSAQIHKSKLPHKQELLEQTREAPISFSPALVRIGLWILSAQGDRLQLIFRQPSDAPVVNVFQAEVANPAGQWQVENLRVVTLRRGR